ncbi:MAG: hypothetical protein ACK4FE_13815 [Azonexus sp.]
MATLPASDEEIAGPDGGSETAAPAVGPFNALTDDLNDLRLQHEHCWLWPQIHDEMNRLAEIQEQGRLLLTPLITERPDWAIKACTGIARSNPAIHQHVERYGSYAQAARSLWTTFIPATPPTLTDAQIYAVMAMHEARLAAEAYCEIAAGIEAEMAQAGVGYDEAEGIAWLRAEIADWERELWRLADQYKAAADRIILMATFAVAPANPSALKEAEAQLVAMGRRIREVEAKVKPYRGGRQPGAVSRFTRALRELARRAGSWEFEDIIALIEAATEQAPVEGIQFQDLNDYKVWYQDIVTGREDDISIANLKRALRRQSAI